MKNILDIKQLQSHPQWNSVLFICQELEKNGHRAFLAGGAVRDALLKRKVKDFDIATSAQPYEVEKIFPNTYAVGKAFGVIVVRHNNQSFEVTTFRTDGVYKDGRRPESIQFSTPENDAARRDFTVNALFFDVQSNQVIDYVDGLKDLKSKQIKTVGHPHERFKEDKLRLLRAIRFSGQLGFEIEEETQTAIQELGSELQLVSNERITEEINKIWSSLNPKVSFLFILKLNLYKTLFQQFELFSKPSELKTFLLGLSFLTSPSLGWSWLVFCEALSEQKDHSQWPQLQSKMMQKLNRFTLSKKQKHFLMYLLENAIQFEKEPDSFQSLLLLNSDDGLELLQVLSLFHKVTQTPMKLEPLVRRFNSLVDSTGHLPHPIYSGDDLKLDWPELSPKNYRWYLEAAFQYQIENNIKDVKAISKYIIKNKKKEL